MSEIALLAVELLVHCLESRSGILYLVNSPYAGNPKVLRRLEKEQLLLPHHRKEWVTCPECGEGQARVLRESSTEMFLGACDACGEVLIPARLTATHALALFRVVTYVSSGLGLSHPPQPIHGTQSWSLGKTENKRGTLHSWYFGCGLAEPGTAQLLRERMDNDKSTGSSTLITSTSLDLLERGPLANLHVVRLDSVARLGTNRFFFDWSRLDVMGIPETTAAGPATTLRHLRHAGYVRVDGEQYDLSPQEQSFLLTLIDADDQELSLSALKQAVGSVADEFKPNKVFRRHKAVYAAFVEISEFDGMYQLILPTEDIGLEL